MNSFQFFQTTESRDFNSSDLFHNIILHDFWQCMHKKSLVFSHSLIQTRHAAFSIINGIQIRDFRLWNHTMCSGMINQINKGGTRDVKEHAGNIRERL